MSKNKSLIFTQFKLSVVIAIMILIVVGGVGLYIARTQNFALRQHFSLFVAKMLSNTTSEESKIILRKFFETQNSVGFVKLETWILDENGTLIYSNQNKMYPYDFFKTPHPNVPYEFKIFEEHSSLLVSLGVTMIPGSPKKYLIVGRHLDYHDVLPAIISISILVIAIILISILITIFVFSLYFRKKNKEAIQIIQELKAGDLSARFKITSVDEVGLLMMRFNEMADQIEHVVRNLRIAENARIEMLKELSHDVKTPLTSLKTLSETLTIHHQKMDDENIGQCFKLINAEINYMEHLITDLLTLAQLSDPKYQLTLKKIDLCEIIQAELNQFKNYYKNIKINFRNVHIFISGDELLIMRLIKNALSNSFRFAKTSLDIDIIETENKVNIEILDDGNGVSADEIKLYGKKKFSRIICEDKTKDVETHQIFLGLGSVIMKEIVTLHQGNLEISNKKDGQGARVIITLSK